MESNQVPTEQVATSCLRVLIQEAWLRLLDLRHKEVSLRQSLQKTMREKSVEHRYVETLLAALLEVDPEGMVFERGVRQQKGPKQ